MSCSTGRILLSTAFSLNDAYSVEEYGDEIVAKWKAPFYYESETSTEYEITISELGHDIDNYTCIAKLELQKIDDYEFYDFYEYDDVDEVKVKVSVITNVEKFIIKNIYTENIETKNYGSYIVKHEYYTKDRDGSLSLDKTVLENEVKLEAGTNLNTNSIERKTEDYLFYEISDDLVTIDKDTQKTITIKYVKDKEYGSYIVKHEYYTKDKGGNLSLDKTVLEDEVELEVGTNLDTNSIERKPEEYTFNEISDDFVVIEKDLQKVITIKYIKDKENVESNVDDVISNNINSVDTSDINVWLYVGIAIVSIIVIVVMLVLVMKKRKKNK